VVGSECQGDVIDAVALVGALPCAGGHVPDFHGAILVARGQQLAIGGKRGDRTVAEGGDLLGGHTIPELQRRSVRTPGGYKPAIRTEEGNASRRTEMTLQRVPFQAGGHVPEANSLVAAGGDQRLSVRSEGDGLHVAGVAAKLEAFFRLGAAEVP